MSSSTSINYPAAETYVNDIAGVANKINELPKASENAGIQALAELGLIGDFAATFDRGMAEVSSYVDSVSTGCKSYIEAVKRNDQSIYDLFTPPGVTTFVVEMGNPDVRSPGGGGGGGSSNNSNNNNNNQKEFEKVDEIKDEDKAKMDNTDKQEQYLSQISMDELDILIAMLKNIANEKGVAIDELFNEEYSQLIKEQLLKEVKLSSEFRDMVDEGSSISLVNALKSLVDGKLDTFKVDEVMAQTLINSVELYAQQHDTTLEELMNSESSNQILNDAMTDFTKIESVTSTVNEETIQEKLLAIYEGNETSSEAGDTVKSYVNALSDNAGTDYEMLLTDESFKDKVYEETNGLNRVSKYADLLSDCSQKQIINSLREISNKNNTSTTVTSTTSTASSSGTKAYPAGEVPLVTLENIGG